MGPFVLSHPLGSALRLRQLRRDSGNERGGGGKKKNAFLSLPSPHFDTQEERRGEKKKKNAWSLLISPRNTFNPMQAGADRRLDKAENRKINKKKKKKKSLPSTYLVLVPEVDKN